MRDPIEVNYEPDGDDWQVTVTGRGKTMRGKAPGLIAARDRADQLVEKLAPNEERRTVVHLLNGDALAFTSAYLSARLARPTVMPGEETPVAQARPKPKPPKASKVQKPQRPKTVPSGTAGGTETPEVPAPSQDTDQAQKAAT